VVKTKTKKKAKTPVRKVKKQTATTEVLKVIASHKKGIELAKLRRRTGFADSTIRGILSKAIKEGKVKRIGRGVYVAA
jgi:predicted transcriptional regulator of viral defense system